MAKFTGKYTRSGRPLWQSDDGELYSEKTMTIPTKRNPDGSPAKDTKWVNVPTVFEGGKIVDDEDFISKFYSSNDYYDPIAKKPIKNFYDSVDSAVEAAKARSESLLDGTKKLIGE